MKLLTQNDNNFFSVQGEILTYQPNSRKIYDISDTDVRSFPVIVMFQSKWGKRKKSNEQINKIELSLIFCFYPIIP